MKLPGFSVARPVFTTMVTLIVVVLGAVALLRLRIDMLPNIELPTVTVRTQYEGASPEVMEGLVTQILEEIIATVPGVESLESQSSEGSSSITVKFAWGTDVDTAALDVQSKIEDEINELPDNIVRPRVSKFDVASFPVVILGVSSDMDPVELTRIVNDQIRHRYARLPGVAQVDMWGEFKREIRIALDPDRMRAQGIGLEQIAPVLRNANLDLPAGAIEEGRHEVMLRAPAEFRNLDEIRSTVISRQRGADVTIGQVAEVTDTFERRTRLVRVNGERGLRVAIRKQADANTVEVARLVLEETKRVNEEFPQVHVVPVVNQGGFIERSIQNVAASALYGGALAIFVLLFFLRSLRSTIVIAVAIPISAIATFALMYFCGFTINLMTLGGLALGIGMMVDSSVVVLENIFRRRDEDREMPKVASVNGAGEVGMAILASTITTLVIFLPLVFVEGVTGVLFQELAYVVMFSLGASLIVALTVVPMLSSRLIKPPLDGGPKTFFDRLGALGDKAFGGLDRAYRDLLRVALRMRLLVVVLAIGLLLGSTQLLGRIGSEFMPPSDEGEVTVTGRMEVGTRQDVVDRQTRRMEEIVFPAVPEMVSSVVSVGASGRNPTASARGQIQISLQPAGERKRSNVEIAEDLHKRLDGRIAGMKIRSQARQGQFLLERVLGSEDGLSVEVRGFSLETLALLAEEVERVALTVPGVQSVNLDTEEGAPQEEIRVDRAKLAAMGLTARDVTSALEIAIAGAQAGEFRVEGNSHRLFVQLAGARQRSIEEVLDLTLQTSSGDQVALRNLVESTPGRGPLVIQRRDQRRTATAAIDVAGRDMGSVAVELQSAIDRIPRPAGYELRVTGTFEEQERAFSELIISLALALMLVYMVLACQYESLRDPLVVMFSVPFAAIGVLVTLFLTDTTLNVQSYIGCIMLGGIVVNNAILLVDQAGQLSRTGMPVREAVAEAGRRRLRPILMTTLTTILALLPLALGIGEGADAQAPLARAVAGGLASSTLITLVLIPCVYSLFHPDRKRSEA